MNCDINLNVFLICRWMLFQKCCNWLFGKKGSVIQFPSKACKSFGKLSTYKLMENELLFRSEGIERFCKIRPIFKILFPGILRWLKTVFMFVTRKWRFPMNFSIIATSVFPVSKLLWSARGVLWFHGYTIALKQGAVVHLSLKHLLHKNSQESSHRRQLKSIISCGRVFIRNLMRADSHLPEESRALHPIHSLKGTSEAWKPYTGVNWGKSNDFGDWVLDLPYSTATEASKDSLWGWQVRSLPCHRNLLNSPCAPRSHTTHFSSSSHSSHMVLGKKRLLHLIVSFLSFSHFLPSHLPQSSTYHSDKWSNNKVSHLTPCILLKNHPNYCVMGPQRQKSLGEIYLEGTSIVHLSIS